MSHKDPVPHCIVYGNPADGFRIVGPFDEHEDALDYMETELHKENCWIMELDTPDPGEDADYDDQGNLKPGVDHA